eukprot:1159692-Pelagomonas_calceolata.AAC.3
MGSTACRLAEARHGCCLQAFQQVMITAFPLGPPAKDTMRSRQQHSSRLALSKKEENSASGKKHPQHRVLILMCLPDHPNALRLLGSHKDVCIPLQFASSWFPELFVGMESWSPSKPQSGLTRPVSSGAV